MIDINELEERANIVKNEWNGIFAPYEAFYIHSIIYAAERTLGAFDRYDFEVNFAKEKSAMMAISAIQEALTHAANLSRFFWPSRPKGEKPIIRLKNARAEKLRQAFQLSDSSPLKDRTLRDTLEHFDERLDRFLLENDAGYFIPTPIVAELEQIDEVTKIFKMADPHKGVFVLLGECFEYENIRNEVILINELAQNFDEKGSRLRFEG